MVTKIWCIMISHTFYDAVSYKHATIIMTCFCADVPIITCPSQVASHVGDRNVTLRCEVKARPEVTALYWDINERGTTVKVFIFKNLNRLFAQTIMSRRKWGIRDVT